MVKERRKYPRVSGNFSLEIADQKSKIIANSINISASGIYCQCDRPMPLFREIEVKVALPDSKQMIVCSGVIVRCEKVPGKERYNIAIFFEDLSKRERDNLTGYVSTALAKAV